MVDFISSILGEYTPVTYEAVYGIGSDVVRYNVVPPGLAGVDWLYVLSGVLFIVAVYSVFKILGGLICKIS